MEIKVLNPQTIRHETKLESKRIRLETKNSTFDVEELEDGSIRLRAYDRTLVIVADTGSSAVMVAAPFGLDWVAGISGQAYAPTVIDE